MVTDTEKQLSSDLYNEAKAKLSIRWQLESILPV